MSKALTPSKFWAYQYNRDVFNLFKEGQKIEDIAKTLNMRPDTVINVVTNDEFRARLDRYLAAKVYMHQTSAILALDDTCKRLWERVKVNIDEIPPEVCLKELTKLISQKASSPKVINPKQYNVVLNDIKDAPEKAREIVDRILDDELGSNPLPEAPDAEYIDVDAEPEQA